MMLGRKLLTAVSAVTLAFSVNAGPDPIVCPSVSTIQGTGVSMAMEVMPSFYLGLEMSNYSTDADWIFAVGPIEAGAEEEAIEISNEKLTALAGPVFSDTDEEDGTVCIYEITGEPDMVAIAASGVEMMSVHKAKQLIQRYRK